VSCFFCFLNEERERGWRGNPASKKTQRTDAHNRTHTHTHTHTNFSYAIWERIQAWLDAAFKERGVQNAYFPSLIPMSFLAREAAHVEGFAPELAVVTTGGGKELEEALAVRPTSETVVNHMFAQWVKSRRDLPLLINQWANVVRWEMRTRPFVRTTEFLWQEGHTAHATAGEATATARAFVELYAQFAREVAALPVVVGRKSRAESFAGADTTFTIEAMMGDGRALQAGTSHDLGSNFARAFGTRFAGGDASTGADESGLSFVHQSSWGVSTRMVGGVVMAHGDDGGARLPPALAPVQVIIIPIFKKGADTEAVLAAADALAAGCKAAGLRARVDAEADKTPGWKYAHWEVKGVPLRAEVGPRDVEAGRCVVTRRDLPRGSGKVEGGLPLEPTAFAAGVAGLLEEVQASLLAQATAFRDSRIVDVASYDELRAAVAEGRWARGWWAGTDDDEARVKEETGATLRCFPFEQPGGEAGPCFMTGKGGGEVAVFARAY
jgi:prolyl-tRNA synthetase